MTLDECCEGECLNQPVCDDNNPCTSDSCDPVDGSCTVTPLSDQTPCGDGNPCTRAEFCLSGQCVNNSTAGIEASDHDDPCTRVEFCLSGQCVNNSTAGIEACDDDDPCTVDLCFPGTGDCQSIPIVPCFAPGACPGCDDADGCTQDGCDPADPLNTCEYQPALNGTPCANDDACTQGTCQGQAGQPAQTGASSAATETPALPTPATR